MIRLTFYPLFLLSLIGCTEPDNDPARIISTADVRIETGTSFGFCIGYCRKELVISEGGMVYRKIAQGVGVANQEYTLPFSSDEMRALLQQLDTETFNNLPHTLGCPDCTDGGAEWFRVVENENVKELIIEYGKPVEGLADFVQAIRTLRDNVYNQFPD